MLTKLSLIFAAKCYDKKTNTTIHVLMTFTITKPTVPRRPREDGGGDSGTTTKSTGAISSEFVLLWSCFSSFRSCSFPHLPHLDSLSTSTPRFMETGKLGVRFYAMDVCQWLVAFCSRDDGIEQYDEWIMCLWIGLDWIGSAYRKRGDLFYGFDETHKIASWFRRPYLCRYLAGLISGMSRYLGYSCRWRMAERKRAYIC